MIDGIPNRPLYFYQKDIIGCEDMKCRKLRFWDLWIVLEVFGIVIDGFPFRRSSRSSPASGIRPLETKEPTGRCFGVVYSGIMAFKYAALGIQQWNLSGSQHLWIIYLCTTAGRPARAFKPGEQVSGSQDGCVFLNGVSGCIWRVGGPGCSMASVSRLAVLIGKIVINDNSISVKIWRYLIFRHTHTIPHNHTHNVLFNFQWKDMGMDQYLLIPFLGGWTSIYQLFWCSPGVQGFDTLPYGKIMADLLVSHGFLVFFRGWARLAAELPEFTAVRLYWSASKGRKVQGGSGDPSNSKRNLCGSVWQIYLHSNTDFTPDIKK